MKLFVVGIALFGANLACAEVTTELLPSGRLFPLTFADPREIRMALAYQGSNTITATIGNYFSIFGMQGKPEETGGKALWRFTSGIEGAGFFTLRQADRRFPLDDVDGLLGLYAEAELPWGDLQLRYTHVSAHLADGSSGTSSPYSRETAFLRYAYLFSRDFFVYAGPSLVVNSIPNVSPWGLQWGGAYFLSLPGSFLSPFAPFAAVDMKLEQDSSTNPSLSVQVGLAIHNPPEAYHSIRFYYSYYTGQDPRGQYFRNSFTANILGIEMQI